MTEVYLSESQRQQTLTQIKSRIDQGDDYLNVECPCCQEDLSILIDLDDFHLKCNCRSTKTEILTAWNLESCQNLEDFMTELEVTLGDSNKPCAKNSGRKHRNDDEEKASADEDYRDISQKEGQTDNSTALRFIDEYHELIRRVPQWKRYLVWDGTRWKPDAESRLVEGLARMHAKKYWKELGQFAERGDELKPIQSFCKRVNDAKGIRAIVGLSASDHRILLEPNDLNTNPNLLNVKNGTVDLKSGQLRSHNSSDLLTQIANVDFDEVATCPRWDAFLEIVFKRDVDLIRYVQKICGVAASGLSNEAILPIAYGPGGNGKSVFWNTLLAIMGEYGHTAPASMFTGLKNEHPTILAALYQKRFVPVAEPEKDVRLKESQVKSLTGNDRISARGMKEDWWNFTPTHTFFLSTNHLPKITGTDYGIWRRIKLIPFAVRIKDVVTPDKNFTEKLIEEESSGILNWIIEGFRLWQSEGLEDPRVVQDATTNYRDREDIYRQFIKECLEVGEDLSILASDLWSAWNDWENRDCQITQTAFGLAMRERFSKAKQTKGPDRGSVVYNGIRLKAVDDSLPPEQQFQGFAEWQAGNSV